MRLALKLLKQSPLFLLPHYWLRSFLAVNQKQHQVAGIKILVAQLQEALQVDSWMFCDNNKSVVDSSKRSPPSSGDDDDDDDDSTVADEEYEAFGAWELFEDTSDVSKVQESTWKTKARAKRQHARGRSVHSETNTTTLFGHGPMADALLEDLLEVLRPVMRSLLR